jgi:hypothetical protein
VLRIRNVLSRIRIFPFRTRISPSRIQGQKYSGSRIRIRIKKIYIFLSLKIVSKLSKKLSGMFNPEPESEFFPNPDPGSESETLIKVIPIYLYVD